MVSVSDVVWKIEPFLTNSFLRYLALLKFPLWAIAIPPTWRSAKNGWTFLIKLLPAVDYRLWPIAQFPGNLFKTFPLVKLSPTNPSLLSE